MRSEHTKLTDQDAVLLGIIAQDVDDAVQRQAPFPLLSDVDRSVMRDYDVFNALNWDAFRIAHPSAFLIDPEGVIRYSYVASDQWDWPSTDLLAAELAKLIASPPQGAEDS